MVELSKKDTYLILYIGKKRKTINKKYKYDTKLKSKCLNCYSEIFISFRQFDNSCVFCKNCKHKTDKKSVIQAQYMRVIKQKQIELIESITNNKE